LLLGGLGKNRRFRAGGEDSGKERPDSVFSQASLSMGSREWRTSEEGERLGMGRTYMKHDPSLDEDWRQSELRNEGPRLLYFVGSRSFGQGGQIVMGCRMHGPFLDEDCRNSEL